MVQLIHRNVMPLCEYENVIFEPKQSEMIFDSNKITAHLQTKQIKSEVDKDKTD